jgi:hypothetical protein
MTNDRQVGCIDRRDSAEFGFASGYRVLHHPVAIRGRFVFQIVARLITIDADSTFDRSTLRDNKIEIANQDFA